MNRRELEVKLAMILGGRAAEQLFFPDISTGAADDLDKATEIARAMVTRYGMSRELGPVTFERESQTFLGGGPFLREKEYSEATAREIDVEVRRLIETALASATECLKGAESFVREAVERLIDAEILNEGELKQLWERQGKAELKAV